MKFKKTIIYLAKRYITRIIFMQYAHYHCIHECVNPLCLSINDGQSNSKKDSVFLISVKIKPKYEIGRMQ
jgi:hypothetical protein